MCGHEGFFDHDVFAAGAFEAGDEPGVDDFNVGARQKEHAWAVRRHGTQHDPGRRVGPAGEVPVTLDAVAARDRLRLALRHVVGAGAKDFLTGGEVLLLGLQREEAQHPVVYGPNGVAPGRGAATACQLHEQREGLMVVEVRVAAVAGWRGGVQETGRAVVVNGCVRDVAQLLGFEGAGAQDGHEGASAFEQLGLGIRVGYLRRLGLHGFVLPLGARCGHHSNRTQRKKRVQLHEDPKSG